MLEMIDVMNTTESLATDFTPEIIESHNDLGEAITGLWMAHADARNRARSTNEELRALRAKLGEHLWEMKQILVKPGRGGQWSSFLEERQIPRATADRLVARHLRSVNPDVNCVIEEFSEPTDEEVQRLFVAVWPKLRRTLRSQQSFTLFVRLLTSHFESGKVTDQDSRVGALITATVGLPCSDRDGGGESGLGVGMSLGPDQEMIRSSGGGECEAC
jgi:hypothetical protein